MPVRIPLLIDGTEGAIALTGPSELTIAIRTAPAEPRVVVCPPLPDYFRSGPAYFAHQLLIDQPFEGIGSMELSRDAQEILEAGRRSMGKRPGGLASLPAFLQDSGAARE
ncbi:MAG TPA: hypothetical protein VFF52_05360 [Isosphaeraceae bacterium]|nr:hypothetical protein [Isosphaeraceae bacterium]